MPIQVLPYIQSPLEQLSPHIQQAAGALGAGLGSHQRNKSDQSILASLQNASTSPIDYQTLWAKLSPKAREEYKPFLDSQLRMKEAENKEQLKQQTEQKKEKRETAAFHDSVRPQLNAVKDLAQKYSSSQTTADAEELNTSGFSVTDRIYTHVNKGVINKPKFEQMVNGLAPRAGLSADQNGRRVRSLERLAGLPEHTSPEKFDKELDKELKKSTASDKKESKSSSSEEMVYIVSPKGNRVQIPKSEVDAAVAAGGRLE